MAASHAATLLLIVMWLHCCICATHNATTKKVTFHKQHVQPCNSSLGNFTRLSGMRDVRSCIVECAANTSCSLLHYKVNEGQCYFATQQQMPICNDSVSSHAHEQQTFVKQPDIMSKLLVFFDFRLSLLNQVDHSRFGATIHGNVVRNSTGAHFPNDAASFIEVDTQGNTLAANFLSHSHNFSFFAKYRRRTYYRAHVHCFHNCSGAHRGCFGDRDGKLWVRHNFPAATGSEKFEVIKSNSALVDKINNLQMVSLGASFRQSNFISFYFNGTEQAATNLGWSYEGEPLCLKLGAQGGSNNFDGSIICYAIATDALSQEEMSEIDKICG